MARNILIARTDWAKDETVVFTTACAWFLPLSGLSTIRLKPPAGAYDTGVIDAWPEKPE